MARLYVEHILRNLTLYFPDGAERAEAALKKARTTVVLKIASLLGEAAVCRRAAARLKMSRKESELLEVILGHAALLQTDLDVPAMVTLLRDLGDDVYPVVVYGISRDLVCQMAEHPVLSRARGLLAFYHDAFIPRRAGLPVLTGDDLMREFGISPSPLLGRILEGIERAFLEGKVATRSEALALAGEILRGSGKSETS